MAHVNRWSYSHPYKFHIINKQSSIMLVSTLSIIFSLTNKTNTTRNIRQCSHVGLNKSIWTQWAHLKGFSTKFWSQKYMHALLCLNSACEQASQYETFFNLQMLVWSNYWEDNDFCLPWGGHNHYKKETYYCLVTNKSIIPSHYFKKKRRKQDYSKILCTICVVVIYQGLSKQSDMGRKAIWQLELRWRCWDPFITLNKILEWIHKHMFLWYLTTPRHPAGDLSPRAGILILAIVQCL